MWKIIKYENWSQAKFNAHIEIICKKDGQKQNALSRVTSYMD